jgi:AAA15 family ATPase/GTPase
MEAIIPFTKGYRMISNFKVENFRCFQHATLRDLRRVNIVVGDNASGKTALLEVLRLGLEGTPQSLHSLNQLRSHVYYVQAPVTRELFEAQFNPFFFNIDPSTTISTECNDTEGRTAKLRVFYDPEKAITPLPPPQFQIAQPVGTIIPLAFERTAFTGHDSKLYASVNPQGTGMILEQGPELGLVSEFFSSTFIYNPQQSVTYFSQLSRQNRESEVVDVIKGAFDLVQDLSILAPSQFTSSMYATIQHLKEKLPLSFVSAGINKFFSILAAIITRSSGVVLIDEIENGIYYRRLSSLWDTILRLAIQYDTQIFASTHSRECLEAAAEVVEKYPDKFGIIRTVKVNAKVETRQFDGTRFVDAINEGIEIR